MIFFETLNFNISTASEQTLPALQGVGAEDGRMLMIFYGTNCTTGATQIANGGIFIGAAVGSGAGEQRSVAAYSTDNVGTTAMGTTQQNSHCGYLCNAAGSATARFYFTRLDDDGNGGKQIVLTHQIDPNDMRFNVCVIYGPSIENAATGSFVVGSSAGVHSVNVGFQMDDGDLLLVFNSYSTSTDNQSISASSNIMFNVGMATSVSDQAYSSMFATDATTTANLNATRQIVGKLFGFYDTTTLSEEAEFAGFTANGFDYELTTSSGGGMYMYYAVLKGPKCKVDNFTVPTGTGDSNHTGFPFTPIGIFNFSNSQTVSSSTRVNLASLAIGSGCAQNIAGACDFAYRSAIAVGVNAESDAGQVTRQCLSMAEIGAVTNAYTIRKGATYKAGIPYTNPGTPDGGFTLTYTTSSTAREFICCAFGENDPTLNLYGATTIKGGSQLNAT